MHRQVGAFRSPEHLGGAVRQHLIRVHVVRSARAGLVHVDDELIPQPAGKNLVGRGRDGSANVGGQLTGRHVCAGRGFLYQDGRGDERLWRAKTADGEIVSGPLGLNSVVRIRRNLVLAEGVSFQAVHLRTLY
jgi:hypothetical protein